MTAPRSRSLPPELDLDRLRAFADQLADTARPICRKYFRRRITVDYKEDLSPVTVADRETERALRSMIEERYPEHGIAGEELGSHGWECRCMWVIDPIDGTKGFVTGLPLFGTLIALLVDQIPVLGVLEMPALRERWVGTAGNATQYNGQGCRTSGRTSFEGASLCATTPSMFDGLDGPRFESIAKRVAITRYGTDCYAYGLLALGLVDLVVEARMKPYDYLGLVAVVEGAGGLITDWQGRPLGFDSDGHVIAAASLPLHQQAIDLLNV